MKKERKKNRAKDKKRKRKKEMKKKRKKEDCVRGKERKKKSLHSKLFSTKRTTVCLFSYETKDDGINPK